MKRYIFWTSLLIFSFSLSGAEYGGTRDGSRCVAKAVVNGVETEITGNCGAPGVECGFSGNPNGYTCFITVNGIPIGGYEENLLFKEGIYSK
jgi:hypothetical protein